MSQLTTQEVTHEVTVRAPAETVYKILADVQSWPQTFPPTVHVEQLERSAGTERVQFWATANGEAKTWTSRRELDDAAMRIEFRQEVPTHPVAAMGGTWEVERISEDESRVCLGHAYRAVDDDPDNLDWIARAVDKNSEAELGALKSAAERGADNQLFSFTDQLTVDGRAEDVYDFLNDAQRWPERLPHVQRVSLVEEDPGVQLLGMETRAADGSTHSTESVRVCFPNRFIAYKQTLLPTLLALHTGYWSLDTSRNTLTVTSQHSVVIETANVEKVLGEGASVADAEEFVRSALGTNSRTTLEYAKEYAEKRR